ncbi:MAG: DUF6603 domain-containing protein [Burkholderiales bacterium]
MANPTTALQAWVRDLIVSDAEALQSAFSGLATLLTGARSGVRGLLQGRGTPTDPWRLPLSRGDVAAELVAWLGPDGPRLGPGRLAAAANVLGVWRTDGLAPSELAQALLATTGLSPDLAALLAGRDQLGAGFEALLQRWQGSDGCVLPPASVPSGINVQRLSGLTQADLVHAVDLESLLGAAPATTVLVAVAAIDAMPWPDIPADRLIDLTAADRAAASFALPTAVTGDWFIALGGRGACATVGDADGLQGQTDRLVRILGAFASLGGGLAVVADAAAGHAARRAAEAVSAVSALVTCGTPLGPVSLQVLDTAPAGDALRLLARLLPPLTADPALDSSEPPDLHLARGLIDALMRHAHEDDPARELRPPAGTPAAPRAGLAVHMLFGEVDAASIRRALTALVAAAVTRRTGLTLAEGAAPDRLVLGLRAGLNAGTTTPGGITVQGHAELQLAQLRLTDAGLQLDTPRDLALHLDVGRSGGWLVGGPDPGRSPGVPRPHELRRIALDLQLPLSASGATPQAQLTLVDARVFELSRERWRLQAAGLPLPSVREAFDAATTLLPEARVLLSSWALAVASDASAAAGALTAALRSLGLIDSGTGSVPDAIEHLLNDPLAHARAVWADAAKRTQLINAVRGLWPALPDALPGELAVAAGPLSARVALTSPWQLDVRAQADAGLGGFGWFGWQGRLVFGAGGVVDGSVSLGADLTAPGITGGVQLQLDRSLRLALRWARPGLVAPEDIELWPLPQAPALEAALARLVPAELTRAALEGLRGLDDSARPTIDAALSLLGLLNTADAEGRRRVLLPAALFADPVAWLRSEAALGLAGGVGTGGFVPARLVQLFDAFKPLLGVSGASGVWTIAPGVLLQADAAPSGSARLSLTLNSSAFTLPPAAAARLAFGGSFSLALPAGAAPQAGVDVYAGLPGTPGRSAVHVALDVGASTSLRLFLRPAVGADVPLFPNPAGLGQLAETAVTQALPLVLDAVADLAPQAGVPGQVGTLVARIGEAMGLRSAGHFSATALQDWAAHPAQALALRLPTLLDAALTSLAGAISPLLPGGASAGFTAGQLQVIAGGFTLGLRPAPFELTIDGVLTGLPAIERAHVGFTLNATGLKSLTLEAGPANINAGGLVLRPMFGVVAGNAPTGGARAQLMLGLPGNRLVGGRWLIGNRFDLVLFDGTEHTAPEQVVLGLLEAVLDLVASFVLRTAAVTDLLAKPVGGSTIEAVLRGAVLEATGPVALVAQPFNVALLLGRLQQLAVNIAQAAPSITIDNALTVGLAADDLGGGAKLVGLRVALPRPAVLLSGDVTLSLETDTRWIRSPSGPPPDGIVLGLLRVGPGAGAFAFEPGISVNGLGLRVARNGRPLLDAGGFSLGSIALHVFAKLNSSTRAGGAQLQLSSLAMGVSGASGGGNGVAQGLLGDAGSGPGRLAPTFSPALAVQKHGSGPVLVGLRAGDGAGPWWLSIQRGFGPLYVEQIGLGVVEQNDALQKVSVLLDGRVSLLGLAAAVDDLQLTYTVASDASVFDPSRWAVDLAGLAFSSDLGGLTLQGGLRKFTSGADTQYVGMLMGRFAVYGLSVFGGYGQGTSPNGDKFASFFAFGAVNGPIGGPPAFFLTGIGGGLGINRLLKLPTEFGQFARYPLIAALDPAAKPDPSPMDALVRLSETFPMNRGTFWFAAGVSFTSFALVDGVAVVSVQIGDGLEVALLGLARMALPRPQVAIVSIELGLVARFSSKEGVLWVQAQLTDNSWLLYPDVRLTGGFAFVVWFAGPNRGQFVLSIGGYHPRFHREGYPVVPRLGLQWRIGSFITIKGESYFALTSEAVMAGVRVEVSATFGPAWAQVIFGADGIVFFDPFHFEVEAYAQISAGVTIDVWIGEITISISIGARILVEGPEFHGIATFSVGPIDLEVEFGDQHQPPRPLLTWGAFVEKYLEVAAPDTARVLAAVAGKGALPPGPKGSASGTAGATDTATADGSAEKPFVVYAEFELMVTNAVPTRRIVMGARIIDQTPSHAIGLAPMGLAGVKTALRLSLKKAGDAATEFIEKMQSEARSTPSFPLGVWGPSQDSSNPKLPSGDVLEAIDAVRLFTVADIPAGTPPIDYHRVEVGARHRLPFVSEGSGRAQRLIDSATLKVGLPVANTDEAVLAIAAQWAARGGASRTAVASLRGERAAPPRLGSLTDGLAAATPAPVAVGLPTAKTKAPVNTAVQRPRVISVLSAALDEPERITPRTTVKTVPAGTLVITEPPPPADVAAATDAAIPAVLHRLGAVRGTLGGTLQGKTVVAADSAALTRMARAPLAAVRGRGAVREVQERIAALNGALMRLPGQRGAIPPGATVAAGELVLMALPNAARDLDEQTARPRLAVTGSTARVVVLRHGGEVLFDAEIASVSNGAEALELPFGAERIAVAVGLPVAAQRPGLSGWQAGSQLPSLGWNSALAAQATLQCEGQARPVRERGLRRESGWVRAADLVAGTALVHTRFARPITLVAIALDDPAGTSAGRGLSLSLQGAVRVKQADGTDQPPVVVVRGQRVFLVYELVPDEGTASVDVAVASEDGWHLVGVVAPMAGVDLDHFTNDLAQRSLDALVRTPVPAGTAQAVITWVPAAKRSAPAKRAARKQPAGVT